MTTTLTIAELDEFWEEAHKKEAQRNSLYNNNTFAKKMNGKNVFAVEVLS